jgi:hypothetical protein
MMPIWHRLFLADEEGNHLKIVERLKTWARKRIRKGNPMSDDLLVKRLRTSDDFVCLEAADRISDETGVVIAAVDNIGNIYVVEAWNFKKKGDELARFLVNKCMQYKPREAGKERKTGRGSH